MMLKERRLEHGYTQEELAKKCNVSRSTIGEIERGINNPSVKLAKRIGKVLGFNWVELFK